MSFLFDASDASDWAALCQKYNGLVLLRCERELLEARGITALEGSDRRLRHARCRRLATRFPGALRELDALDAVALRYRRRRLDAGLGRFERLMIRFHAVGRLLLRLKRWHGAFRREHGRRATIAEARLALDGFDDFGDQELRAGLLPAGGSGPGLLWKRLSLEYHCPIAELKAVCFSPGKESTFGE